MRAFIYCRVSTKEQGSTDHYSLDNQEQRCRDYIKLKRWQLLKCRKDIASGKNDDREGFQELLAAIDANQVDVIVVYRLDRLSRNVRDIYDFLDKIKNCGVAFVSVTEGFDTTTAMGRAMLGVAAVFAQLTREMISENTKDGLLRRREAGLIVGDPNRIYGYNYDAEAGILSIKEDEAAIVRQIFDWYTEDKWGTQKIARVLNVRKLRSKTGIEWNPRTLDRMLSNPTLSGRIIAGTKIVDGKHEPIVSVDQFQLAQEINSSRKKYPNRSQQSQYLLSGLIRCANCGRRLRAHTVYKGKNSTPYTFYYHASSASGEVERCRGIAKSIHMVDSAVVDEIARFASRGIVEKTIQEEVKQRQKGQAKPKGKLRDKLLIDLKGLEISFSRWADRLDAGKIDEEQFEQQNQRLLQRKRELQRKLQTLEEELGDEQAMEVTVTQICQTLRDFPSVWQSLEHEERREILRLLIERLHISKTQIELKLLLFDSISIPFNTK